MYAPRHSKPGILMNTCTGHSVSLLCRCREYSGGMPPYPARYCFGYGVRTSDATGIIVSLRDVTGCSAFMARFPSTSLSLCEPTVNARPRPGRDNVCRRSKTSGFIPLATGLVYVPKSCAHTGGGGGGGGIICCSCDTLAGVGRDTCDDISGRIECEDVTVCALAWTVDVAVTIALPD